MVKDNRIQISVEESDDPIVMLKFRGCEGLRFKASDDTVSVAPENPKDIKEIIDAVHQAYMIGSNNSLNRFYV